MPSPEHPRPARSLFERAEITTKDVALFVLGYGVLVPGIIAYLWWRNWGSTGEDDDFRTLRLMGIAWFLLFVLYARGAVRMRLKEIARRDGITPEILVSQVATPIQTNKERVVLLGAILVALAFGSYGIWWWKYASDGVVTGDDLSSLKLVALIWVGFCVMAVLQGLSGARNMRRQLEAQRRVKSAAEQRTSSTHESVSEERPTEKVDRQP